MVNLLDNAVRHAASRVSASVRADGGWAVARRGPTTGQGFPPKMPNGPSVASLGSTTHAAGSGEEGAGLGLAIVRSTAEAHGGSVSLS